MGELVDCESVVLHLSDVVRRECVTREFQERGWHATPVAHLSDVRNVVRANRPDLLVLQDDSRRTAFEMARDCMAVANFTVIVLGTPRADYHDVITIPLKKHANAIELVDAILAECPSEEAVTEWPA